MAVEVNTSNLAMGPGVLYVGDFGAAEPAKADTNSDPNPAVWRNTGGTLGGLTQTVSQEYTALQVDQIVERPESRVTSREVSVATTLAEVTLENLALAIGSGTIDDSDDDFDEFTPSNTNSGDLTTYNAIIFDGRGGRGKRRRVIVRKVLSTDNVEIVASKDGQTGYKVNFISHYVSSVVPSYKIYNEK